MSPTQRTLAKAKADGWAVAITEKWNPFAKIRQDLFGCIDVLCIRHGETLGIQCTTMSNKGARIEKIKKLPNAEKWLLAGNRLEIWAWRKIKGKWAVDITKL